MKGYRNWDASKFNMQILKIYLNLINGMILTLLIGSHLHRVPPAAWSWNELELFPNFYIECPHQNIDWIREAFKTDFLMKGIEIVYFKGREQRPSLAIKFDSSLVLSPFFVLFVLTNGSYPSLLNNTDIVDNQRLSENAIVLKFPNRNLPQILHLNILCVRRCMILFAMVLTESPKGVHVTFVDGNDKELGVQLPADQNVTYKVKYTGITERSWKVDIYDKNFILLSSLSRGPLLLSTGLYKLFLVGQRTRISRMFKYAVAASDIRIFPMEEYESITLDVFETFIANIMVVNAKIVDRHEYFFFPKFRTRMGNSYNKQRFRFNSLGLFKTTLRLYPELPVEDHLDLIVYDLRSDIITYYPLEVLVKDTEFYEGDEEDNSTTPEIEVVESDDLTTVEFPTMFDYDAAAQTRIPHLMCPHFILSSFVAIFASLATA